MSAAWTPVDLDIVDVLSRRVRLMSLAQLSQLWKADLGSPRAVQQILRRLCLGQLLQRTMITAHPRLEPTAPLVAWYPGAEQPEPRWVVERIRSRWTSEVTPIEVYWASPKAANLFGSTSRRLPTAFQRDHDLLLSDVYAYYRLRRPDLVRGWAGEHALPKAGFRTKDPDSFLFDDAGQPVRVIESAGRYDLRQLQSFHDYCCDNALPYELW